MAEKTRAEPKHLAQKRRIIGVWNDKSGADLECSGYTSLSHSPEIAAGVDKIAELIGSMTIHLMENRNNGDVRIRNGLSRKIDINPYSRSTRSQFIKWIVRTMFLEGDGNAVVYPVTNGGYIEDLRPIPASMVAFIPVDLWDYRITIGGLEYEPDNLLHFTLNPSSYYPWKGRGYSLTISDVANNLKQAAATEKGFMASKWKPSLIIKTDALVDEFSSEEGRSKLLKE